MIAKKLFKVTAVVFCVTALSFIMIKALVQKKETLQTLPPAVKLRWFQGKNPPFNFTFEYPEAWRVRERGYRGDYDMVEVIGTSEKDSPLLPGIFVTKRSQGSGEGTPQRLTEEWLKTEGRYKDFKILSSKETEIAGLRGQKTEYVYSLSLPLWSSQARKVTVKKEQNIFLSGNDSFQITFMGTEEQYKIYLPFFRHVLKTFKFLDRQS